MYTTLKYNICVFVLLIGYTKDNENYIRYTWLNRHDDIKPRRKPAINCTRFQLINIVYKKPNNHVFRFSVEYFRTSLTTVYMSNGLKPKVKRWSKSLLHEHFLQYMQLQKRKYCNCKNENENVKKQFLTKILQILQFI